MLPVLQANHAIIQHVDQILKPQPAATPFFRGLIQSEQYICFCRRVCQLQKFPKMHQLWSCLKKRERVRNDIFFQFRETIEHLFWKNMHFWFLTSFSVLYFSFGRLRIFFQETVKKIYYPIMVVQSFFAFSVLPKLCGKNWFLQRTSEGVVVGDFA